MSNVIQKLVELFIKFPGIGPRQARRFVYYLLSEEASRVDSLIASIKELRDDVSQCKQCMRYHTSKNERCDICSDSARDKTSMMILEKDIDLENVRASGHYNGKFFILGGLLGAIEKDPDSKIRGKVLVGEVKRRIGKDSLKEVIIALSVNPDGDVTLEHVKKILQPFKELKISILGRGLSTGTELEYSDAATIKSALENRK